MVVTPEDLIKIVAEYREDSDDAHQRLRESLRGLSTTVESNFRHFEDQGNLLRASISAVAIQASTPVDARKLVLTTPAIIAVVLGAVSVAASYWNLSTKLDAQQRAKEASDKLWEVQMTALGGAVAEAKSTAADAKRQYELLRYDFQSLKETVIGKGKQP